MQLRTEQTNGEVVFHHNYLNSLISLQTSFAICSALLLNSCYIEEEQTDNLVCTQPGFQVWRTAILI